MSTSPSSTARRDPSGLHTGRPDFAFRCARQLPRRRAGTRFDGPHVVVRRAIRIGVAALAQERDLLAVGRPRGRRVVDLAARQDGVRARGQIEHRDVLVLALEIALPILLEAIPIDHDRRRGLALPALFLLGLVVRIDVAGDKRDARAVGRPLDVGEPAGHLADLQCLAARSIEQPELRALLLLLVGAARPEEREVLAVRAPPRRRLAIGRRGQADLLAAVPLHHPDVGVAPILFGVDGGHCVGHPRAFGRALRIADCDDPRVIVEGDGAFGLRTGVHSRQHGDGDKKQRCASHGGRIPPDSESGDVAM